jgi:hypothetical protein
MQDASTLFVANFCFFFVPARGCNCVFSWARCPSRPRIVKAGHSSSPCITIKHFAFLKVAVIAVLCVAAGRAASLLDCFADKASQTALLLLSPFQSHESEHKGI